LFASGSGLFREHEQCHTCAAVLTWHLLLESLIACLHACSTWYLCLDGGCHELHACAAWKRRSRLRADQLHAVRAWMVHPVQWHVGVHSCPCGVLREHKRRIACDSMSAEHHQCWMEQHVLHAMRAWGVQCHQLRSWLWTEHNSECNCVHHVWAGHLFGGRCKCVVLGSTAGNVRKHDGCQLRSTLFTWYLLVFAIVACMHARSTWDVRLKSWRHKLHACPARQCRP